MKKYRLQEGIAWICFKCKRKIHNEDDMIMYDHRLYHRDCAMSLIEKIKNKLFRNLGLKNENKGRTS